MRVQRGFAPQAEYVHCTGITPTDASSERRVLNNRVPAIRLEGASCARLVAADQSRLAILEGAVADYRLGSCIRNSIVIGAVIVTPVICLGIAMVYRPSLLLRSAVFEIAAVDLQILCIRSDGAAAMTIGCVQRVAVLEIGLGYRQGHFVFVIIRKVAPQRAYGHERAAIICGEVLDVGIVHRNRRIPTEQSTTAVGSVHENASTVEDQVAESEERVYVFRACRRARNGNERLPITRPALDQRPIGIGTHRAHIAFEIGFVGPGRFGSSQRNVHTRADADFVCIGNRVVDQHFNLGGFARQAFCKRNGVLDLPERGIANLADFTRPGYFTRAFAVPGADIGVAVVLEAAEVVDVVGRRKRHG